MSTSPAAVFARLTDPNPPTDTPVLFDRAVVMGGSVAGLMAARVLADHTEEVIIVERDDPGTSTAPRPGVPQGGQVHALLPSGLAQLERWFPGFMDQAVAAGGRPMLPSGLRRYIDGQPRASDAQQVMLSASRPFIEAHIRKHVLALPNVKAIVGRATGVEFSGDAATGVRVEADGAETVERADFVVDAMGRSSRLGDWLEQAGWQRPPMQRMTVDLNYASAVFHRDDEPEYTFVLNAYTPQVSSESAGASVSQIEGDRWLVLVAGYAEHRPGQTIEDLIRVCRTELTPEYAHAVDNEVVEGVRTYRHPDSRRRDYHLVKRMPARLISVGDAVASSNPIYGQGMASGTLHASCLSEFLRSRPDLSQPARGFFARQKVVVDAAWSLSTASDLQLPHVNGPYPRFYRIRQWLSNQVAMATVHDPDLNRLFDEVTFLLRHPRELTRPSVRLRAIRLNRRAKKQG
jgi:2-polyprenyl-6-methoxyphenol hydroxylase-like FAD-dependent oxidoreductase